MQIFACLKQYTSNLTSAALYGDQVKNKYTANDDLTFADPPATPIVQHFPPACALPVLHVIPSYHEASAGPPARCEEEDWVTEMPAVKKLSFEDWVSPAKLCENQPLMC